MAKRGDGEPKIWNGGGCYVTGMFGFLLKLMFGYIRTEKR